jgi:group I intron endonuclease
VIGVYAIRNTITGHVYIGSSRNIKKRWTVHQNRLSKYKRKHPKLQNSWLLYGASCFELLVLETCSVEELKIREQRWLLREPQLNICTNAWGGRPEISDEQKERIVKSNKTRVISDKVRNGFLEMRKSVNPMQGKQHSEETKRKLSEARKQWWANKKELA